MIGIFKVKIPIINLRDTISFILSTEAASPSYLNLIQILKKSTQVLLLKTVSLLYSSRFNEWELSGFNSFYFQLF